MMKIRYAVPATLLALAMFGATPALAQDEELMMSVVEDAEADEAEYAGEIELPEQARSGEGDDEESDGSFETGAENAIENSDGAAEFGIGTAREARQLKEHAGDPQEIADHARDLGRDSASAAPDRPDQTGSGQ